MGEQDAAVRAVQQGHVLPRPGHGHQGRGRVDDLDHHPLVAHDRVQRDRFRGLLVHLEHDGPGDVAHGQGAAHHAGQAQHLHRQAVLLVVQADQEPGTLQRVDEAERRRLWHADAFGDLLKREA